MTLFNRVRHWMSGLKPLAGTDWHDGFELTQEEIEAELVFYPWNQEAAPARPASVVWLPESRLS